jgi:MFS transporter, FSR family, fosmidomycin resistance protein
MRWMPWQSLAARAATLSRDERRTAAIAGTAHALHDGYTDLIYVMLPLWQAEFALSYAALGLLRSMFVGAMAILQIPAGLWSERIGGAAVLALGTALAGFGYCVAGLSTGFAMLLGALVIGGAGASAQHPIASALVARAFAGPRSLKALGTYNFSGDLGKMTVPATLSLMLLALPWRPALAILGSVGLALACAATRRRPPCARTAPTRRSSWPTGSFCRSRSSTPFRSARSTCMPRCCRAGAAPRRSIAPSWPAIGRPA